MAELNSNLFIRAVSMPEDSDFGRKGFDLLHYLKLCKLNDKAIVRCVFLCYQILL